MPYQPRRQGKSVFIFMVIPLHILTDNQYGQNAEGSSHGGDELA